MEGVESPLSVGPLLLENSHWKIDISVAMPLARKDS